MTTMRNRDSVLTRRSTAGVILGVLLLTACGSSDEPDAEQTDAEATQEPETDAPATAAGTAFGESTCVDPEDDSITFDQEAADTFAGDAYGADTVEVTLEHGEDGVSLRTRENQEKLDRQPAGPLRFDLWMASEDGSETGLVRVSSPAPAQFDVEAGTDEGSLETVDGASARMGAPGSFLLDLDPDVLPVLEKPYRWAMVETFEGNGTADICPNAASLEDPLADPDALTAFPG